jgi:hypothetical protein
MVWRRPSVCLSVRLSVRPSVCPSVRGQLLVRTLNSTTGRIIVWRRPSVRPSVRPWTIACPDSNSRTVGRRNFIPHGIPHGSRMFPIAFKVTGLKVKATGGHVVKTLSGH